MNRTAFIAMLSLAAILYQSRYTAAYPPIECLDGQSRDDFQNSDLIVMGRVTGIEHYRGKESFFVATITVRQAIKGNVKPGNEILFLMGFDFWSGNSESIVVANTHPGWPLGIGDTYVLCLRKSQYLSEDALAHAEVRRDGSWQSVHFDKRQVWEPRSCHMSIHKVLNEKEPVKVSAFLDWERKSQQSVLLTDLMTPHAKMTDDQRAAEPALEATPKKISTENEKNGVK